MSATLTQDQLKALVGQAALAHVVPGEVLGVGTGSLLCEKLSRGQVEIGLVPLGAKIGRAHV